MIRQARLLLGYRSGQLILVEYKDREIKVIMKLNKNTISKEGFFSKASSYFGSEDGYRTWLKGAIKSVNLHKE